ncbi:MAG: biotin/lipoyl-binding protein [Planctomycetota bacterium]
MTDVARNSVDPEVESLELPVHHLVGKSRAGRKLAFALGILLVVLPVLLLVVPWQQNVPGAGRITAFDPLDRIQVVPAPVTGRLVELRVREGSRVEKGQEIAIMEDLDPLYAQRLDDQVRFARVKREQAHINLETLDAQLVSTEEELLAALRSARADVESAVEKVIEAEKKQEAEEKLLVFDRENADRQARLFARGQASEKEQQKAEADYGESIAKVAAAKAAVNQARAERRSKEASVQKIDQSGQAKINEVKGKEAEARQKLQDAEKALQVALNEQALQATRVIKATADGTVLRAVGANFAGLVKRSDPLLEIVPDTDQLAVEMWMRGIDAPLVQVGRKARMQFEGWPAVQFAGWPSVAVGTFGGVVAQVDAQAAADGRVRVLILPDPEDDPWPAKRFLRQGVRASGWVQLETVSTGYEIWRQLNAFPPTIQTGPMTDTTRDKKGPDDGDKKKGGKEKS